MKRQWSTVTLIFETFFWLVIASVAVAHVPVSRGDGAITDVSNPTLQEFFRRLGGRLVYSEDLFRKKFPGAMVLVPNGRSLERAFADARNPRVLRTFDIASEDPMIAGTVSVAYTASRRRLEVIVRNNTGHGNAGYNDFLVVDDFAPGLQPKIRTPVPGLCTACHQDGLEIFSVNPWLDTASSGVPVPTSSLDSSPSLVPGGLLKRSRSRAAGLDRAIEQGVEGMAIRQALRKACPEDVECRLEILRVALIDGWSPQRLAGMLEEPRNSGSLSLASHQLDEGRRNNDLRFPFEVGADPLLPRKAVRKLWDVREAGWSWPIERFGVIEDTGERLLPPSWEEFISSPEVRWLAMSHWPVLRSDLNRGIRDFMNGRPLSRDPAPRRSRAVSAKEIFQQHCASCHGTEGFAAVLDIGTLGTFVGRANSHRNAEELVSLGLMPPKDFPLQMTDKQKSALLDYLGQARASGGRH